MSWSPKTPAFLKETLMIINKNSTSPQTPVLKTEPPANPVIGPANNSSATSDNDPATPAGPQDPKVQAPKS